MNRFVALLSVAGLGFSSFAVEIIGHRGASYDAPENTLAAFLLAFEQGADAAELDIHLSQDGKIVVIHDADLKRTGGEPLKIAEHTFDEIRARNVGAFGKWKGRGFQEKVPSLAEVLEIVPPGKRLFIEIKVHGEILPALEEVFRNSKLPDSRLPIITFHYEVAKAAKARFPDHEVYWLADWSRDRQTGRYPELAELIEKAKEARLDGLDLNYRFPIDRDFVKKIHSAGLKLCIWTVDDAAVARAAKAAGVDGITTNRPGWLRNELESERRPTITE